jgi:DNA-binding transcriptional MerR regulator
MSSSRPGTSTEEAASGLTIGEVAERTGLSVHALRFYEREGILPGPVRRGANGHRVYGDEDLEWLEICSNLRASGMPLAGIRRYAELVRQGPGNEQERLALLREHRKRVTAQIAEFGKCLDLISWKVAAYEDRLARG